MAYQCEECGATFPKLSQHRRAENHCKKLPCHICGKVFTCTDNLDGHMEKHKTSNASHCEVCGKAFSRPDNLHRHLREKHQVGGGQKRPVSDSEGGSVKRLKKDDNPRQYYTLTKIKEQRIEKFKTIASSYKVTFQDIEVTEDVLSTLKTLFTGIFQDLTKGAKSEDLVRLAVQSPSLDYPIVIPFLKIQELTANRFMSEIGRVLQSNEDFTIDSELIIELTPVDMPSGGVGKWCKFNTDMFLQNKRCTIRIQNNDDLCCARAIVTAKARIDNDPQWNSIRLGRGVQTELARKLHEKSGVPIGKCGIEEVKMFQHVLSNYKINILSREHFNGIIYSGPEAENKIYLYFHDNHYDVITSMPAFLSRSYYCISCKKGYDHTEKHKCNNVCHACRKVHKQSSDNWVECDKCHRFFKGQECFELHKKTTIKGNSTCKWIYRCTDCGKTVNGKIDKNHVCIQVYCKTCEAFYPKGHKCYMKPEEPCYPSMSIEEELIDEEENSMTFICFYLECTQDDLVQCETGYTPDVFGKCQNCLKSSCGSYEHRPNLCVAQKVCTVCMDQNDECDMCGQKEYVFFWSQYIGCLLRMAFFLREL